MFWRNHVRNLLYRSLLLMVQRVENCFVEAVIVIIFRDQGKPGTILPITLIYLEHPGCRTVHVYDPSLFIQHKDSRAHVPEDTLGKCILILTLILFHYFPRIRKNRKSAYFK